MPTPTDRIISHLPRIYRNLGRDSILYTLLDVFGGDLAKATNVLTRVLRSHWVDHADREVLEPEDLPSMAALFGLLPHPQETAESFRHHLKHSIQVLLGSTVTVQGILRVAAEVLDLSIAYSELDCWWIWPTPESITLYPARDDAAELLFGVKSAEVHGTGPQPANGLTMDQGASPLPAVLTGTPDLSAGLDLSEPMGRYLRLAIDGTRLVEVDLASQVQDPEALKAVPLDQLVAAINGAAGLDSPVASHDGRFLTLTSPTSGPEGRIELLPPAAQDATQRLLGAVPRVATGSPPRAAQLVGSRDLSAGVDLRSGSRLWLRIDGPEPGDAEPASQLVPIDAGREAADRASVRHFEVVTAINTTLTEMFGEAYAQVARQDGRVVSLISPHPGPQSFLSLESPIGEYGEPEPAEAIFGFPPCRSQETPATAALLLAPVTLTGKEDLADGLTLPVPCSLVLGIDDSPLREIRLDPRGSAPPSGSANGRFRILLEEIAEKINNAFHADFGGAQVAATDGRVLSLASPSRSLASAIWFAAPSVQSDASDPSGPSKAFVEAHLALVEALFGIQLLAVPDPGDGPYQSQSFRLAVGVDQKPPVTVEVPIRLPTHPELPADPLNLAEIRDAINIGCNQAAGGVEIARLVPAEDWVPDIAGEWPHPAGVETHLLWTPLCVTRRLALLSPTAGTDSSIRVVPLRREERRHYVTRAMVTHEAAQSVLGFVRRKASGEPATAACVTGSLDLRRGIDLRTARHLRLRLDDGEFLDVDCGASSNRLHAATLAEVIDSLNQVIAPSGAIGTGMPSAAARDHHLEIRSGTTGLESRITFETPRPEDALPDLLGVPPGTHRGTPATGIVFTGVADLTAGAALPPEAAIRIAIHPDQEPVAIVFPARDTPYTAQELAATINAALGQPVAAVVADAFGVHLQLMPPGQGSGCLLELAPPTGVDVTERLVGVPAGRTYRGSEGTPAVVTGLVRLPAGADLSTKRRLRLSINGQPAVVIDCAGTADDPTSTPPDQIVEAINMTAGAPLASLGVVDDEQVLVLTSPEAGGGSEISLESIHAPDASALLFGEVPEEVLGAPAIPARLVGEVDLLRPVDLSERKVLRLVLSEGGDPLDIDVAGADPARTDLSEIITAINTAVPGLASATPDDRLLLTAPPAAAGESYLAVRPLRYLELIEYPLQPQSASSPDLGHGHGFALVNPSLPSATHASASIELQALQPIVGPALVNHQGDQVRLFTTVQRGETVLLQADAAQGLRAEIVPPSGDKRAVPPHRILVGPIGTQVWLPCILPWRVHPDSPLSAQLQLNNPAAPHLVLLRARRFSATAYAIQVAITPTGSGSTGNSPPRFHVRLQAVIDGKELEDFYPNVSIGDPDLAPGSLVYEMVAGAAPSRLALAESVHKGDVLRLPQGRSTWRFLEHATSRLDQDHADQSDARYATIPCGGLLPADPSSEFCEHRGTYDLSRLDAAFFTSADPLDSCYREQGVFGVSRFAAVAGDPVVPVFAPAQPSPFRLAQLTMRWQCHQAGSFVLNLPAELSSRFMTPEKLPLHLEAKGAVLQPEEDATFLEKRWCSQQVPDPGPWPLRAKLVVRVPIGWRAIPVPVRTPHRLSLGHPRQAARLYLQEPGSERFLELKASEPGAWGNDIAVTVRRSRDGPAHYDVNVVYPLVPPEDAQNVVKGEPSPRGPISPAAISLLVTQAAGVGCAVIHNSVDPLN